MAHKKQVTTSSFLVIIGNVGFVGVWYDVNQGTIISFDNNDDDDDYNDDDDGNDDRHYHDRNLDV